MRFYFRKCRYQLLLIHYLKSGEFVNHYRVKEQVEVLKSLFGKRLKNENLVRYRKNLDKVVKLDDIYYNRLRMMKDICSK